MTASNVRCGCQRTSALRLLNPKQTQVGCRLEAVIRSQFSHTKADRIRVSVPRS